MLPPMDVVEPTHKENATPNSRESSQTTKSQTHELSKQSSAEADYTLGDSDETVLLDLFDR